MMDANDLAIAAAVLYGVALVLLSELKETVQSSLLRVMHPFHH